MRMVLLRLLLRPARRTGIEVLSLPLLLVQLVRVWAVLAALGDGLARSGGHARGAAGRQALGRLPPLALSLALALALLLAIALRLVEDLTRRIEQLARLRPPSPGRAVLWPAHAGVLEDLARLRPAVL
jgi:hypothetical protein